MIRLSSLGWRPKVRWVLRFGRSIVSFYRLQSFCVTLSSGMEMEVKVNLLPFFLANKTSWLKWRLEWLKTRSGSGRATIWARSSSSLRFLLSLVENRRRERFPLMCELLLHHIRVREISIRYSAALRRKIMLSCLKPHQLNVYNDRNAFRDIHWFPNYF